jgi:hypothetical protein
LRASLAVSNLEVGTTKIRAVYFGDANFKDGKSDKQTVAVAKAATTLTLQQQPNPVPIGQPVSFIAHVAVTSPGAGDPSGAVQFRVNGTLLGTAAVSGGQAQITVDGALTLDQVVDATYSGDNHFLNSSASILDPTTIGTTISMSDGGTTTYGTGRTLQATVQAAAGAGSYPTMGGTVSFFDGAVLVGSTTPSSRLKKAA